MAARLGNVLYWLGMIIAVLVIGGAIIWNAWTFYELRQTRGQAADAASKVPNLEEVENAYTLDELADWIRENKDEKGTPKFNEVANAYKALRWRQKLASASEAQDVSLKSGGALLLLGLISYGIGWATRYILRGPVK